MFKRIFKFVLAVSVGSLLWSTMAPEAFAGGRNPRGPRKVVAHKEVFAAPGHNSVFVHRANGRPPMVRPMHVVIPRSGYAWAPGRWTWDRQMFRWVYIEGRYIRHRQGYVYQSGYWMERGNGFNWVEPRWVFIR